MANPYDLLGVKREATPSEIKQAYRRLAKKLHPDLNPGQEQKFKEVTAAYELLSDSEKKARFDAGEIDETGQETARHFYHQTQDHPGFRRYQDFDLNDLFRGASMGGMGDEEGDSFFSMFRRGASKTQSIHGEDEEYILRIPFEEAALGGKHPLILKDGRKINVTIPVGADSGQRLRLRGQGSVPRAGLPAGDAFVTLQVNPHPLFRREGRDIHINMPISIKEAVLGGKIEVPTLKGRVRVSIPSEVNGGHRLRLKGKGLPETSEFKEGDQYVTLELKFSTPADPELKQFLEQWKGESEPEKTLRGEF